MDAANIICSLCLNHWWHEFIYWAGQLLFIWIREYQLSFSNFPLCRYSSILVLLYQLSVSVNKLFLPSGLLMSSLLILLAHCLNLDLSSVVPLTPDDPWRPHSASLPSLLQSTSHFPKSLLSLHICMCSPLWSLWHFNSHACHITQRKALPSMQDLGNRGPIDVESNAHTNGKRSSH